MDWLDLVPRDVAIKQIAWERAQRVRWAKHTGATVNEISLNMGISRQRVYGILYKGERCPDAPVEKWMRSGGELAQFFWQFARMKVEADRLFAEYHRLRRLYEGSIRNEQAAE